MKLVAALVGILAVGMAGSLAAQTNTLKDSPPPLMAHTVPVVLGEVTGVTSHSVSVRTTRGEAMNFETDSRTVMPMNLTTGRRVKVEFHLMESGDHHAGRITTIEPGSKDWDRYDEELAMVPRSGEDVDDEQRASMNDDSDHRASGDSHAGMSHRETSTDADRDDNTLVSRGADDSDNDRDELPRTASRQPLLLGAGLAALALGLVIAFARRRRAV